MLQQNLDRMAEVLKLEIQTQLQIPRQHQGYNGEPKNGVSAPIASGQLLNNIDVVWEGSFDEGDLTLLVKMEDYWYYVNYGRKPGKWPPIAPIDKWVVSKRGLRDVVRDQSGRFIKRKSLVFLIRRSIGELGWKGTEFLQNAAANSQALISKEMGEAFGEWFGSKILENEKLYK